MKINILGREYVISYLNYNNDPYFKKNTIALDTAISITS